MTAREIKVGGYRDARGHPYRLARVGWRNGRVCAMGSTFDRNGTVVPWSSAWRGHEETGLVPDAAPPAGLGSPIPG